MDKLRGIINKIVQKKEDLIYGVLPDMTLKDISQRCSFISRASEPDVETLTLDGEKLITFYPLEVKHEQTDNGINVKIELPYYKHQ